MRSASLFIVLSICALCVGDPLVGDGGFVLSFDHRKPDLIAFNWVPPTDSFTIESWIRIYDPWVDEPSLFGFSAFDATQNPVYNRDNEIEIRFRHLGIVFYRGSEQVVCATAKEPRCDILADDDWVHIAISWNKFDGTTQFYKNGELIANVSTTIAAFFKPVVTHGCMLIGHDPDVVCNSIDVYQAFHGTLDEFRVWSTVRTPQQIKDNFNISLPGNTADLNLYYKFDIYNSGTVLDASDTTPPVPIGSLPMINNLIYYSDSTIDPLLPFPPTYVKSHAPVFGSGVAAALVLADSTQTIVTLPAYDSSVSELNITIASLPLYGTLSSIGTNVAYGVGSIVIDLSNLQSKQLIYTPNDPSTFSNDSFIYSVSNGGAKVNGTVQLLLASPTPIPSLTSVMNENSVQVLSLGGIDLDANRVNVSISQLPLKGKVYQAAWPANISQYYSNIQKDVTLLTPFASNGDNVQNFAGILLYAPDKNEASETTSSAYTTIGYEWKDSLSHDQDANVTVVVKRVNVEPVVWPEQISISLKDHAYPIELNSTDADINYSYEKYPYYYVTQFPKMGSLYQVNADGSMGDLVFVKLPATVISYVVKVLNFSSQYSRCGCNYIYQNCSTTCTDTSKTASKILGAPDTYPSYGDLLTAWEMVLDQPKQWIELQFQEEVYIQQVEVFETYNPGTVVEISSSPTYSGVGTQWESLWHGTAAAAPATARIFSPSVCPTPDKTRYVRLDLNTSITTLYVGVDAVRLTGTIDPPSGRVLDPSGRIIYKMKEGVHSNSSNYDFFSFQAFDCQKYSSSANYSVVQPAVPTFSMVSEASLWYQSSFNITTESDAILNVNITPIYLDLEQAFGIDFTNSSPSFEILLISASGNSKIYNLNSDGSRGSEISSGSTLARSDNPGLVLRAGAQGTITLDIWISSYGFTYRERITYNASVPPKTENNTTLYVTIGVVIGVVILLLIIGNIVLFVYLKKRKESKSVVLIPPDFEKVEFGDLKSRKVSRRNMIFLLTLQELLMDVRFASLILDIAVTKQDPALVEKLVRHIFYIYRGSGKGKALSLISFYAKREIEKASSKSRSATMLRDDTVLTKMLRRYMRVVGLRYIWNTFAPVINELEVTNARREVIKNEAMQRRAPMTSLNEIALTKSPSIGYSSGSDSEGYDLDEMSMATSGSFEVDPTKFTELDNEQINKLNLLLLTQRVFNTITVGTFGLFPVEIQEALDVLLTEMEKCFPESDHLNKIGVLIFLRFLCPVLIAPHNYGILEKPPSPSTQRVLVLTSKVLQNLSNNVLFEQKEEFMSKLNDFIIQNRDEMRGFLDKLIFHPHEARKKEVEIKISPRPEKEKRSIDKSMRKKEGDEMTETGSIMTDDTGPEGGPEVIPREAYQESLRFVFEKVRILREDIEKASEKTFSEIERRDILRQLEIVFNVNN